MVTRRCLRPQVTPYHWQKWWVEFHELKNPCGSTMLALNSNRAIWSVSFPRVPSAPDMGKKTRAMAVMQWRSQNVAAALLPWESWDSVISWVRTGGGDFAFLGFSLVLACSWITQTAIFYICICVCVCMQKKRSRALDYDLWVFVERTGSYSEYCMGVPGVRGPSLFLLTWPELYR